MPLPRFRLRTLMIAVAVVGAVLAVAKLVRASRSHRQAAARHARQETAFRLDAAAHRAEARRMCADARVFRGHRLPQSLHPDVKEAFFQLLDLWRDDGQYQAWAERWEEGARDHEEYATTCARKAEYHATQKRKYDRAVRRPWEAVAPDPPVPRGQNPLFEYVPPPLGPPE